MGATKPTALVGFPTGKPPPPLYVTRLSAAAVFFVSFAGLKSPAGSVGLTEVFLALLIGLRLVSQSRSRTTGQSTVRSPQVGRASLVVVSLGGSLIVAGFIVSLLVRTPSGLQGFVIVIQYIFAFVVVVPLVSNRVTARNVLRWLILGQSTAIIVAIGIRSNWPVVSLLRGLFNPMVAEFSRFNGLNGNPNALAKALAISVPLLGIAYILRVAKPWACLLHLALWAWAMFATASFGGFVAFSAAVVATAAIVLTQRSGVRYLLLGLACFLVVAPQGSGLNLTSHLPERFQERVIEPGREGGVLEIGSGRSKLEMASSAWGEIGRDPLIGSGPGASSEATTGTVVHNTYLLIWSEGGLLALTGMCSVFAGLFLLGGSDIVRGGHARSRVGGLFIVLILVFGLSITTSTHVYSRNIIVPLAVGMALMNMRWSAVEQGNDSGRIQAI